MGISYYTRHFQPPEAAQHLLDRKINISLPLSEGPELNDQIKQLRIHFYFKSLPNEFIKELALPDPGYALLPQLN